MENGGEVIETVEEGTYDAWTYPGEFSTIFTIYGCVDRAI